MSELSANERAAAAQQYAREEFIKIGYKLEEISRRMERLEADAKAVKDELILMKEIAARWKGGFLVVLALGGLVTWISGVGGGLMRILK